MPRRRKSHSCTHHLALEPPGFTWKAPPPWAECALGSSSRTGAKNCPPCTDCALGLVIGNERRHSLPPLIEQLALEPRDVTGESSLRPSPQFQTSLPCALPCALSSLPCALPPPHSLLLGAPPLPLQMSRPTTGHYGVTCGHLWSRFEPNRDLHIANGTAVIQVGEGTVFPTLPITFSYISLSPVYSYPSTSQVFLLS